MCQFLCFLLRSGSSNVVVLNDEQPISSSLPTAKRFLAQQQFGKRQKRVPCKYQLMPTITCAMTIHTHGSK